MVYVKNLPWWERAMRIGAGAVAAVYALTSVGGALEWVILAAGAAVGLTGIFGFCPACALAGRRLEKRTPSGQ